MNNQYELYKISLSEDALLTIQALANLVQPEPRTTLTHTPGRGYTLTPSQTRNYVPDLSLTLNTMPLLGPPPLWLIYPTPYRSLQCRQHGVLLTPNTTRFFTDLVAVHDLPRRGRATPITIALEHIGQRILRPPLESPPLYELVTTARQSPNSLGNHSRLSKAPPAELITDPTDPRYIQAEPDIPYNY